MTDRSTNTLLAQYKEPSTQEVHTPQEVHSPTRPEQREQQARKMDLKKCLLVVLSIFLPPLAVLLHSGCTIDLVINIVLTLFGFLPGVAHAIFVIVCYDPNPDGGLV